MNQAELAIISKSKMQKFFQEKMGPLQEYDAVIVNQQVLRYIAHSNVGSLIEKAEKEEKSIRLPLPIDPRNPERGIEGMIKGFVTLGKVLFRNTWFVTIRVEENGVYKRFDSFKGNTPTLVLLQALEAQLEGV